LLGGWVAEGIGVGWAVGGAGLVGMLLALILSIMWTRARAGADPTNTVDGPPAEAARRRPAHRAEISETTATPRRSSRRRLVNAGNQHRHRA
jgi:hypothetical protein